MSASLPLASSSVWTRALHHAVVELGPDRVAHPLVDLDRPGERGGLRRTSGATRRSAARRLVACAAAASSAGAASAGRTGQAAGAQRLGRVACASAGRWTALVAIGQLARRRALLTGRPGAAGRGPLPPSPAQQSRGAVPARRPRPDASPRAAPAPSAAAAAAAAASNSARCAGPARSSSRTRDASSEVRSPSCAAPTLGPGAQGAVEPVEQAFALGPHGSAARASASAAEPAAGDPHGRFTSGAPGAVGSDVQTTLRPGAALLVERDDDEDRARRLLALPGRARARCRPGPTDFTVSPPSRGDRGARPAAITVHLEVASPSPSTRPSAAKRAGPRARRDRPAGRAGRSPRRPQSRSPAAGRTGDGLAPPAGPALRPARLRRRCLRPLLSARRGRDCAGPRRPTPAPARPTGRRLARSATALIRSP